MLRRLPVSSSLLLKRYGSNGRVIVSSNLSIPLVKKSLPAFLLEKFTNKDINSLTAILDGYTNRSMTYNDVYESTYKFASILRKLGIQKGTCVAIMSPNHIHYFTSFHAIGLNGAYSTTVNPLYTNDELIHQLKATDSSRIMVISDLAISHVIDFSILSHNINHTSFIIHHSLAL
jgi:long-subunit acyl-CoA synthetase (AMP-forming)